MVQASRLKIVHVFRAPMGGVLRHVRDLSMALADKGHHVGLVCDVPGTTGYNEAMLEQLAGGLALGLHRVPMDRTVGPGDIKSARNVLAILRKLAPDIVHGHGAKGGVYARAIGAMANQAARPARLYSPHGGSLHYDPKSLSGRVYFAVERMLERSCETILFVAEYEQRAYRAKIGVPRCASQIIYNGLSDQEFEPVPAAADAADFLFIGEMRMLKGPDLFVDAIAALNRSGHDRVSAVMVGAGPDRDAIAERIANASLEGAITMQDPMPARQAFAMSRNLVVPSRAEAMPYIVLEALGAAKPTIASRVGGIPEIMGADSTALVEPTVPALQAAMSQALTEPEWLPAQMPEKTTFRDQFGAGAMADAVIGAYKEALARARPGHAVAPESAQAKAGPSNVS